MEALTKEIVVLGFIITSIVAYYSYQGGVWLWQNLHDLVIKPSTNTLQLKAGASLLLILCLSIVGYLLGSFTDAQPLTDLVEIFTLLLAVSLAYNLGYLLSIVPRRNGLKAYTGLLTAEIALFPLALALMYYASPYHKGLTLVVGTLFFVIGFSVWEQLRQSEMFKDEHFRQILWYLSLGFDAICVVIVVLGILSQGSAGLLFVSLFSILLVFISLSFYCLGLLVTLNKSLKT